MYSPRQLQSEDKLIWGRQTMTSNQDLPVSIIGTEHGSNMMRWKRPKHRLSIYRFYCADFVQNVMILVCTFVPYLALFLWTWTLSFYVAASTIATAGCISVFMLWMKQVSICAA